VWKVSARALYSRANGSVPAERLRINSAGNVGIGTTTPTATLQVSGTFIVSNSAQTTTPSLYVGSNGNVGIGTSSTGAKLTVAISQNATAWFGTTDNRTNANVQIRGTANVWADNASSVAEVGAVDVNHYNAGVAPTWTGSYLRYYGSSVAGTIFGLAGAPTAAGAAVLTGQNANVLAIGSNTYSPIQFFGAGGTLATITGTGNVGIGTVTPTVTLQVSGTFTVSNSAQVTTPSLFVASSGNVGVGTSSPGSLLTVVAATVPTIRTDWTTSSSLGANYFYESGSLKGGVQLIGSAFATTAQQNDLELLTTGGGTGGDITFAPGNTGNMVEFKANGSVGIGTASPAVSLTVIGEVQVSNSGAVCNATRTGAIRYVSGTGTQVCNSAAWTTLSAGSGGATPGGSDQQVQFNDGGSAFGGDTEFTWNKTTNVLTVTGDINYTGLLTDTSDRRQKTAIHDFPDDALERVMKLKPVSFQMKKGGSGVEYGFIAQDVEPLFPELVRDREETLSLNYIGLMAPMVKAIQEMKTKNDVVAAQNRQLRETLSKLVLEVKTLRKAVQGAHNRH